ncbi:MAG TPA: BTAD domain-containing putative transcriptional regulator [Nocardioides sp.]|nr:BTAD domain-containing putative transcriptional regulator [Nocardioides sp.]
MEIRLLGPVEATVGETTVALGPPRQRAVAAMLALAAPEVVSTDRFVDGLWGERPPDRPLPALQVFVHGLRKALAAADPSVSVERVAPGYRITGVETDVHRFEDLVRRAEEAADPATAEAALREALALVRGPALADLVDTPFAEPECARLDEMRLLAEENWYDARLHLGEHASLVTDLELLVRQHPTRERLWAQLMTAQYRADRQADALATYARARDRLADELGIDPGEALQQLELAVLRHDPDLAAPSPMAPGRGTTVVTPRAPARLETPTTPTFGRDEMVADLRGRLADPDIRVVTLTGPGGSGKSRVAALVAGDAARFPGGVVAFAASEGTDDGQLLREIARALTGSDGGDDPIGALPPHALVVLDNLEALDDASGLVARLVAGSEVTVLTTSRLPLRLRAEQAVPVPPLPVPAKDAGREEVLATPSAAMYVNRAVAAAGQFDVDREWAGVGRLMGFLDGLPLAIELAASHAALLSPDQILESIQTSLDVLSTRAVDVPERQRTLARTIDWSYQRLEPAARALLDRLALFERSFTIETAQAVLTDVPDLIASLGQLVEVRLVRNVPSRVGLRFQVLGTVRAFLRQRTTDRADLTELQERLTAYLHDQARTWRADLDGPQCLVALGRYDDAAMDLDAAVDRTLAAGDAAGATALVADVTDLWVSSGRLVDGSTRVSRLLELLDGGGTGSAGSAGRADDLHTARAAAHLAAAKVHHQLSHWDRSAEESAEAIAAGPTPGDAAWARCLRANALLMNGDLTGGRELAAEALALAEGVECYPVPAIAHSTLAIAAAMAGEFDVERAHYEHRLAVVTEHGDVTRIADTLNVLAEIALDNGDPKGAYALAAEAVELAGAALPNEARDATISLARSAAATGDVRTAAEQLRDALALIDRTGQTFALGQALRTGGLLATALDEPELALRCFAAGHQVAPSPSGTEEPIEADLADALAQARAALGAAADRVWLVGRTSPPARTRAALEERLAELLAAEPAGRQ